MSDFGNVSSCISSDTRTIVSCYVSTITCIISMLPGKRLGCVHSIRIGNVCILAF